MGIISSLHRPARRKIDLEDDYHYQFFMHEAQQLKSWCVEWTKAISEGRMKYNDAVFFNIELIACNNDISALRHIGKRMISMDHPESAAIELKLKTLIDSWENFLFLLIAKDSRFHRPLLLMKYIGYCKDVIAIICDQGIRSEDKLLKNVNLIEMAKRQLIKELKKTISIHESNDA